MISKNAAKNENTVNAILAKKQNLLKEKQLNPLYAMQEVIQAELKPVIESLIAQDKKIIAMHEKTEKLYTLTFNSETDKSIELLLSRLTALEKAVIAVCEKQEIMNQAMQSKSVSSKPESSKPETVKPDSNDAFKIFTTHFTGNVEEKAFNSFFRVCDFSSPEKMADSFKEYNSTNKMLCARKSNQPFKQALWETYSEMNKGNKTVKQQTEQTTLPAKTIKTFANKLNCEEKHLEEWINVVKLQGFIDMPEDKEILVIQVESAKGIECEESDIDDFISFISESLKLKIKE